MIDEYFTVMRGQNLSQAIGKELGLSPEQTKELGPIWDNIYNLANDANQNKPINNKRFKPFISLSKEAFNKIVAYVNKALGLEGAEKESSVNGTDSDNPKSLAKDPNPPANVTNPRLLEEYDKKGNRTRGINYENGNAIEYFEAEYDENGNMTRDVVRDLNGNVIWYRDIEYDTTGKVTREIMREANGDITEFTDTEYNENGRMKRLIERDKNGDISEYKDFEYDENSMTKLVTERDANGNVSKCREFEYDVCGNLIRVIERDANGKISIHNDAGFDAKSLAKDSNPPAKDPNPQLVDEYDKKGNHTRGINYENDKAIGYFEAEYDGNGKMTRDIARDLSGNVIWYRDVEYNAVGKPIRVIERDENGNLSTCEDIEYNENGNLKRIIERNANGDVKIH